MRLLQKWKYGEPVVIVSGLPRSGTSMLMGMLEAGGANVLSDQIRQADEDNPRGYFEYERVKNLAEDEDKSWVQDGRGKTLKVISHLLKDLPEDNFYLVLFARRDLEEVVASQNLMLKRQAKANPVDDAKAVDLYRKHLVNVRFLARRQANFRMLEVVYREIIDEPALCAGRINQFLGGNLDPEAMAAIVDHRLYRNRKEEL